MKVTKEKSKEKTTQFVALHFEGRDQLGLDIPNIRLFIMNKLGITRHSYRAMLSKFANEDHPELRQFMNQQNNKKKQVDVTVTAPEPEHEAVGQN